MGIGALARARVLAPATPGTPRAPRDFFSRAKHLEPRSRCRWTPCQMRPTLKAGGIRGRRLRPPPGWPARPAGGRPGAGRGAEAGRGGPRRAWRFGPEFAAAGPPRPTDQPTARSAAATRRVATRACRLSGPRLAPHMHGAQPRPPPRAARVECSVKGAERSGGGRQAVARQPPPRNSHPRARGPCLGRVRIGARAQVNPAPPACARHDSGARGPRPAAGGRRGAGPVAKACRPRAPAHQSCATRCHGRPRPRPRRQALPKEQTALAPSQSSWQWPCREVRPLPRRPAFFQPWPATPSASHPNCAGSGRRSCGQSADRVGDSYRPDLVGRLDLLVKKVGERDGVSSAHHSPRTLRSMASSAASTERYVEAILSSSGSYSP